MKANISVLHVVAGLHPNAGGPSRTVVQLTDGLARESDIAVSLLSQSLTCQPTVQSMEASVERRVNETASHAMLVLGLPLRRALQDMSGSDRPNLIHSHGLWLPANAWAAQTARRERIPLAVHPRGMLEPWALDYRAWRKRLAMYFYQRRDLEAAKLFFATAPQEKENLRRLGLKQPVAIIPNGVELPAISYKETKSRRISSQKSLRNVVFMSRIHPIKGLLNLVESWGRVRPEHWRLRLAGMDESGYLTEVMRRVQTLRLDESIEYLGEVEGDTKKELLGTADLFVLPSFSENFGVVVAEAMAYGLPVITTRGTPWEGLLHHGCGWWIEPTVDALTEALREALGMDSANLRSMGDKGRKYAEDFNWAHIAQETAEVYRWVLGQGAIPNCVFLD